MLLALIITPAVSNADPTYVLVNYGALGVMLALFVIGRIHSDSEVRDLKAQNVRLVEALTNVQAVLAGRTLPAMERQAQVLEALPESETTVVAELRAAVARLESLSREGGGGR